MPTQVIVHSPAGTNNALKLPFGTSLYDLKAKMPLPGDLLEKDGLRLFTPAAALVRIPESFYRRHLVEAQLVLKQIRDSSEILGRLLDGGHWSIAGRLAGAFRRMSRPDIADEILVTMKAAGYDVRESDPFEPSHVVTSHGSSTPAIVGRLQALWEASRETVLKVFPAAPGLPSDHAAYLNSVDESYQSDGLSFAFN